MRYYPFDPPSITKNSDDEIKKPRKKYYIPKKKIAVVEEIKGKELCYTDKVLYLSKLANPKGYTRSNYTIEQITNKLEQHGKK